MSEKSVLYQLYHAITQLIPKISWPGPTISVSSKTEITEKLAHDYYIILTGDKNHLSSRIISWMSFLLTGKPSKYSHVLMNCDFVSSIEEKNQMKFVEATAKGVHYSSFDEVFDGVTNVCLLSPKNIEKEKWTEYIDFLVKDIGIPYDDLYDLADRSKMSCVEVVLDAFNNDAKTIFPELEEMIKKYNNLTPQMFRDCQDLIVEYEVENE